MRCPVVSSPSSKTGSLSFDFLLLIYMREAHSITDWRAVNESQLRSFAHYTATHHCSPMNERNEVTKYGSAHVFNELPTLSRVESEIFARGGNTGVAREWNRYGLFFEKPIGTRIGQDGTRTLLHYGEMKMRENGLYHLVPRTGPRP